MNHHEGTFSGIANTSLFYQVDLPEQPLADIVLVHGYAEHSNRYRHVIEALNEAGYGVWSYDHRGHGRSEGSRAIIESFEQLIVDLSEFVRLVRRQNQGRDLFMLGHSMGGMVSTAYALEYAHQLKGLILSSPAFKIDHTAPKALLALSPLASAILPNVPASPFDISGISRDEAVRTAYMNDEYNYIGGVKARMGYQMLLGSRYVQQNAHKLNLPVLMVIGEQDPIASPQGAIDVFSRFSSRDKQLQRYPEAFHEVLNEPEQTEILEIISDWLAARTKH